MEFIIFNAEDIPNPCPIIQLPNPFPMAPTTLPCPWPSRIAVEMR
jgi:hypothetical protein